jgi:hypothetical protein
MRSIAVVAIFALVSAQAATLVYSPYSFCQRYTTALNMTQDSAGQTALMTAVVTRAATGFTGATNVTGLFNSPINKPFFDGSMTGSTNWMVAPNTANLVGKLVNFFAYAMNCRAVTTTTPGNQQAIHSGMAITKAVWDDFFNNIANTLVSYGVTNSADLVYATALLGQFKKTSVAGMQICNQADCEAANGFGEFTSGTSDGNNAWVTNAGTNTVTVAQGSTVHFNIGNSHNVVQTDSAYAPLAGGFTSGIVGATNTYNWVAPAQDVTIYFKCGNPAHEATMRASIIVGAGTLSGAASASASVAVVVAAVAAALALRF